MKPETLVSSALCRFVEMAGGEIRKCHWEQRLGAPDYLILLCGRAFFVETKAAGQKPRPSQMHEFAILAKTLPVLVIDSPADARFVVQAVVENATDDIFSRLSYKRFIQ